jgi:uncharacterized protein YceK
MKNIIITVLIVVGGCSDKVKDKSTEETQTLKVKKYQNILSQAKLDSRKETIKFSLLPSATIIDLPNNAELEIKKSSFIDQAGNPYTDTVTIELNFIKENSDYLRELQSRQISNFEQVKYLFEYSVKSKNGSQLCMDKYDYPKLRFHPSENLRNTSYGVYDSSTLKWVLPVHQDFKSTVVSTFDSSFSKVTDHMNNDEVYYIDT